jgi:hypothetical protein
MMMGEVLLSEKYLCGRGDGSAVVVATWLVRAVRGRTKQLLVLNQIVHGDRSSEVSLQLG